MKIVYKYKLPITGELVLNMPKHADLLRVGIQGNAPVLWAMVDKDAVIEPRSFRMVATGQNIEDASRLAYVDTFQVPAEILSSQEFVGHLFEEMPL